MDEFDLFHTAIEPDPAYKTEFSQFLTRRTS